MWGTVALIPPAAFFYLLEFYTHNPFAEVRPWAQLFNIVLFELLAGIFLCITGRLRTAYRIEGTAALVFGLANAYVVRFRTNPLVPWDILSWRTAVSVSGNYDFTPDTRMIVVTILFLALIIGLQPVKFKIGRPGFFKRCLPGVVLGAVLVMFAGTLQQENFQNEHRLYNKLFTPVFMTQVDGIPVTFVMNLAYMSIEKPQKYSVGEAKEFLKKYEKPQETEESIDTILEEEEKDTSDDTSQSGADTGMPNIIVVMNELFSDLSVLGDFETNEDYMPFIHSLEQGEKNTVTGMLNVSVCGGNTANTEFEFLTGNTMAFLPQGSIPYQQYILGASDSLATLLKGYGYETRAFHPGEKTSWQRNIAYPRLGFDSFKCGDDMDVPQTDEHGYVSDQSDFEQIIWELEHKEEGKPLFLFNVTIQNHGAYTVEDYPAEVTVEDAPGAYPKTEQYLTLANKTDEAFRQLVEYFEQQTEPTIIVMFGDHQPSVEQEFLDMAYGVPEDGMTMEQYMDKFKVPFVIWANYPLTGEKPGITSLNFLAQYVLRDAGIQTSAFGSYLWNLTKTIPAMTFAGYFDSEGNAYSHLETTEMTDLIRQYQTVQYNELFGGTDRQSSLFAAPVS